ncbi:MAG: hypothetical protein EZS28_036249 [Streblomastix strix]|uniref:Uncharacterized protein n=1 Tax=Streblomastix strix TaxID=222440 RepID=A0A5J4UDF4_9EUKA|nr:MAG: hypothetical protein EZS28_036249 [Streblomastix strix]
MHFANSQTGSYMLGAQVIAMSDAANKDAIEITNLLPGIQQLGQTRVKTKISLTDAVKNLETNNEIIVRRELGSRIISGNTNYNFTQQYSTSKFKNARITTSRIGTIRTISSRQKNLTAIWNQNLKITENLQ